MAPVSWKIAGEKQGGKAAGQSVAATRSQVKWSGPLPFSVAMRKTLQWQLKVITKAINAAAAAAAVAAATGEIPKTEKGWLKNAEEKSCARNLFVINRLAISQTITKMLSTLRHVNTNTNTFFFFSFFLCFKATLLQFQLLRRWRQRRRHFKIYGRVTCFFNCTFAARETRGEKRKKKKKNVKNELNKTAYKGKRNDLKMN